MSSLNEQDEKDEKELWRALMEALPMPLALLEADGTVVFANAPAVAWPLERLLARRGEDTREWPLTVGLILLAPSEKAAPAADEWAGLCFDAHKQRILAALAAGVAHDINNPLSGILQSAQLLSHSLNLSLERSQTRLDMLGFSEEEKQKLAEYIAAQNLLKFSEIIMNCGQRSADMINNLLSLARRKPFQPEPIALERLCERALFFLRSDGDLHHQKTWRQVGVTQEATAGLPEVMADPQHAVLGLVVLLKWRAFALCEAAAAGLAEPSLRVRVRACDAAYGEIALEDNAPWSEDPAWADDSRDLAELCSQAASPLVRELAFARTIFCHQHHGAFRLDRSSEHGRLTLALPFARAYAGPLA